MEKDDIFFTTINRLGRFLSVSTLVTRFHDCMEILSNVSSINVFCLSRLHTHFHQDLGRTKMGKLVSIHKCCRLSTRNMIEVCVKDQRMGFDIISNAKYATVNGKSILRFSSKCQNRSYSSECLSILESCLLRIYR